MGSHDDAPDAFDNWLCEIEQRQLIDLADVAIREAEIRGMKHARDLALAALKETTISTAAPSSASAEVPKSEK
jgi:hypothetical protein